MKHPKRARARNIRRPGASTAFIVFGLAWVLFGAVILSAARKTVVYCQRDGANRAWVVAARRGLLSDQPAVALLAGDAVQARVEELWYARSKGGYRLFRSLLQTRGGEAELFPWTRERGDHAAMVAQINAFLTDPQRAEPFGYEHTATFRTGVTVGGALVAFGTLLALAGLRRRRHGANLEAAAPSINAL